MRLAHWLRVRARVKAGRGSDLSKSSLKSGNTLIYPHYIPQLFRPLSQFLDCPLP